MASLHVPDIAQHGPHTEAEFEMMWSHVMSNLGRRTAINEEDIPPLKTFLDGMIMGLQHSMPKDAWRPVYDRLMNEKRMLINGHECSMLELFEEPARVLNQKRA